MDRYHHAGFLEKMFGPLPGQPAAPERFIGDAIGIHLNLLLNTRRGSVPHLRHPDAPPPQRPQRRGRPGPEDNEPYSDYGMPDVSSFYSNYPASMEQLRQEIELLVRHYEPRLLNPRVYAPTFDKREFRVSFLIEGEVEDGDDLSRVRYRTTIDRNGQVLLDDPS